MTFDKSPAGQHSLNFSRMSFSRESLTFYFAFTVILMIVTYGCWWLWVKREGRMVDVRFQTALSRANTLETEKGLSRAFSGLSSPASSKHPALESRPAPVRQGTGATFMSIVSSSTTTTSPPMSPLLPVHSHFSPLPPRSTRTG